MSCNLLNNEAELLGAFNRVVNSQTGNEWTIFEYDGNSNIVKPGATGTGGLDELLESFNSSKVQYGFASIQSGGHEMPNKIVMIHWVGRVNLTIYARNEEDLDKDTLVRQFAKIQEIAPNVENNHIDKPTNNGDSSAISADKVKNDSFAERQLASVEVSLQEREEFWNKMQNEEEARRKEEAERRRLLQEQFAKEQKQLEANIHQQHLEKQASIEKGQSETGKTQSELGSNKMSKFIAGRTQMFEQQLAELAHSGAAKPPKKAPKNFKWQVGLQATNPLAPPVNQVPLPPPKKFECVLKPKELNPTNLDVNHQQQAISETDKTQQSPPFPPSPDKIVKNGNGVPQKPSTNIQAKTLFDYQAEDSSELSFNPGDLITNIQQVHDGKTGLFPSNYVQLIE